MGSSIGVAQVLAGGDAVSDELLEFLDVRESSCGLPRPDQLSLRSDVEDAAGPWDERELNGKRGGPVSASHARKVYRRRFVSTP